MNKKIFLLLFHVFLIILYRILGYSGHFGYDDMEYAKVSYEFSQGVFDSGNHFSYRWSLLLPTAISYLLFGINDIASSIPPIIASSIILLLVFQSLKDRSVSTIWVALSITTTAQWFLFYSNKLMPDIYICLAYTGVIYSIIKFRFKEQDKPFKWSLIFIAFLFYGLISKGTIILIIPLLLYFLLLDIFQKSNRKFWLFSLAIGSIFIALYLGVTKILSGEFLSRIEAIEENGYINLCSYNERPLAVVLKRIGQDFFLMIRNEGFAFAVLLILIPFLSFRGLKILKSKTEIHFLLSCALILFLTSNFMSISLSGYSPMCIDFRHYLFLVPIIAMASSPFIGEFLQYRKYAFTFLILSSLIIYSSWQDKGIQFHYTYLPLWILFLLAYLLNENQLKKLKTSFLLLFTVILLAFPAEMILNARINNYPLQQSIIQDELNNNDEKNCVFTDDIQARIGNYLAAYDTNNIHFVDYDKINRIDLKKYDSFGLLLNSYTANLVGPKRTDYPYFFQNTLNTQEARSLSNEVDLQYYPINKLIEPSKTGRLLKNSTMDFEIDKLEHWNINPETRVAFKSNSGNYSNLVRQYSATFELRLDELIRDSTESIYVRTSAFALLERYTNSSLVISVEDSSGTYAWKGLDLNIYQNVYTHWWKATTFLAVPKNQIRKDSKVKVFVWNQDNRPIHIDDIKVEIFGFKP